MDQDTLHTARVGHIKLNIQHIKYRMSHKFAHNINESNHMTYTIAHIADGFGHSANIFG